MRKPSPERRQAVAIKKPAAAPVKAPAPKKAAPVVRRSPGFLKGGIKFDYIKDIISELKKVAWPKREDAINLTIMVIVVSVAVGLLLGGVDWVFSKLAEIFILK
ncbi:MAG: preprotein translocase subunit SecE [Chloroflexi bacterium]|nr:preprotein translocase subunit SecE [Chloroflexota bacterium]